MKKKDKNKKLVLELPKRNPLVVVVMQKKTKKHKNKKRSASLDWCDYI